MKFTKKQRENLAKALYDVGKLVLTALVLGQFISQQPFVLGRFLVGLIIFLSCFIFATLIDIGE